MTWKLLRARIIKHVSGPFNAKGTDVADRGADARLRAPGDRVSAEPFTAFAFAVELRLPGSDRAAVRGGVLRVRRPRAAPRDHPSARRGRPATVRLLPGRRVVRQRDPAPRDDVELRPLGLVGARAARARPPAPPATSSSCRPTSRRSACASACTAACRPSSPGPTLNARGQRHRHRVAGARVRGDRHRPPGRQAAWRRATSPSPRPSCASSTRASSARSTRRAGSRCRSTRTSCGRRSATSSARRRGWTCGSPSTSTRRRPEAAARPTTSAA